MSKGRIECYFGNKEKPYLIPVQKAGGLFSCTIPGVGVRKTRFLKTLFVMVKKSEKEVDINRPNEW